MSILQPVNSGPSPIKTTDPVRLSAPNYQPGSFTTYAGLLVTSQTNINHTPVSVLFHTGSLTGDLVRAIIATRGSLLGNGAGGFSSGWIIDPSLDSAITDGVP